MLQEKKAPIEGVGRLWQLDTQEKVLPPEEINCMKATVRLSWDQPGPYVVVEADPLEEDSGIELVLEILPTRALLRSGEESLPL